MIIQKADLQVTTPNTFLQAALHKKFTQLGRERNRLTYQLLKLLPEINHFRVYEKYGYPSIITYAGIIAGLSEGVVKKTLNLEKHLANKPLLKEIVGTEGIHKVAIVARLATQETEKEWVDRVKNMNRNDLQELAKEIRDKGKVSELDLFRQTSADSDTDLDTGTNLSTDTILETGVTNNSKSLPCQAVQPKFAIELDEESQFLFLKLKKKMGRKISNKEALKKMLKTLNEPKSKVRIKPHKTDQSQLTHRTPKQQKNKQCKFLPGEKFDSTPKRLPNKQTDQTNSTQKQTTRYIQKAKEREVIKKYKCKCAYPGCNKPYEALHHTDPFSKSKSHNSIVPLCGTHHNFAHNGLIENMDQSPKKWKLRIHHNKRTETDELFRKYRRKAIDNTPPNQ